MLEKCDKTECHFIQETQYIDETQKIRTKID